MALFLSCLIIFILCIVMVNSLYAHWYGVVNMPSTPSSRRKIVQDIADKKGECDTLSIIECGSGWGGLARLLSRTFPKADISGIEISPVPYLYSKLFFWNDAHITRANLFHHNFTKADIVILYLSPMHMEQLYPLFEQQMKSGAIVYSQGFPFKSRKEDAVIDAPFSIEKKIYRYRF